MNDPWPAGSPEARWRLALDDLEAALSRQRAALDHGEHTDPAAVVRLAFTPPRDLPPIPRSLESRARRLLAETEELIEQARTSTARLAPIGHHVPSGRRPAARFDRRM